MGKSFRTMLTGVIGFVLIADTTALLLLPSLHSGLGWHDHDVMQRRMDHILSTVFPDMYPDMYDMYDLGLVPKSYISSYRRPECKQDSLKHNSLDSQEQPSNHKQSVSEAELARQAKISELQQQLTKQAKLREEHEKLEKEVKNQIRLLEEESQAENPERKPQAVREQADHQSRGQLQQMRRENQLQEKLRREEEKQREQDMIRGQAQLREQRAAEEELRQQREELRREREERLRQEEERTRLEKERELIREQRRAAQAEKLKQMELRRQQEQQRAEKSKPRSHQKIVEHMAAGYHPDDITVTVANGKIRISGNHICTCTENCITKEFTRSYSLPPHIDPSSVEAVLDEQGKITLTGERLIGGYSNYDSSNVEVKVRGVNVKERPSAEELRACLNSKGGIKLNKVDKKTGQVVDSVKATPKSNTDYELQADRSRVDNDEFSTIEVEL